MAEQKLFKDYFDAALVNELGERIHAVYPAFDVSSFTTGILDQLPAFELKDRVRLISRVLRTHLPESYPDALEVLLKFLGPVDKEKDEFMYGFGLMPIAHFVETNGLAHFDASMAALYEITKRHTAEFAIRPFLLRHEARTLTVLRRWAKDDSEDVRRLVSEGTRPRLPWASRLAPFVTDPGPVISLLRLLKDDPSLYVRRSVANNLNDISKDHPERVVETLKAWQEQGGDQIGWIVGHALRGLIKQGDRRALSLMGFEKPKLALTGLRVDPPAIRFGNSLEVRFELESRSNRSQRLVVDYIIQFVKANGQRSPKVFKLSTRTLKAQEKAKIQKRHAIKPITTRRYYAGTHRLEIQVNGEVLGGTDFELVM
jgi:3-methyladenine DNA glycosylase AlkC